MNRVTVRRWLPVGLYGVVALCLLVFGFIPYNRKARQGSLQIERLRSELQAKVSLLEQLPRKQTELNALVTSLGTFRRALRRTDQVDEVMDDFKRRATVAGLELWMLNPSVPALVKMDSGHDRLAQLDLAILPVSFECRGTFADVGRFLEAEESRSEFCKWQKFALSADPRDSTVHARGDAYLFLLPEANFQESAT
jgi:Tfp pilus assembly protein PilO